MGSIDDGRRVCYPPFWLWCGTGRLPGTRASSWASAWAECPSPRRSTTPSRPPRATTADGSPSSTAEVTIRAPHTAVNRPPSVICRSSRSLLGHSGHLHLVRHAQAAPARQRRGEAVPRRLRTRLGKQPGKSAWNVRALAASQGIHSAISRSEMPNLHPVVRHPDVGPRVGGHGHQLLLPRHLHGHHHDPPPLHRRGPRLYHHRGAYNPAPSSYPPASAIYRPLIVLHPPIRQNGIYSALPSVGNVIVHFATGPIFDHVRSQNALSLTKLRKIFHAAGECVSPPPHHQFNQIIHQMGEKRKERKRKEKKRKEKKRKEKKKGKGKPWRVLVFT